MIIRFKTKIEKLFQAGWRSHLILVVIIAFMPVRVVIAGESLVPSVRALTYAADGLLYGLDADQQRLVQFDHATGKIVRFIELDKKVSGNRQADYFTATNSGFLVGSGASVWSIDKDGIPLFEIARPGTRSGKLDHPSSVFQSLNNRIYVAEAGADRVSIFGSNGVYLFGIGNDGDSTIRLDKPYKVFVDANERIYILDRPGRHRLSIFDFEGKPLQRINIEKTVSLQNQRHEYLNLTIDDLGRVYLVDVASKSVIKYDWQSKKRSVHILAIDEPPADPAVSDFASIAVAIGRQGELAFLPAGQSRIRFQSVGQPSDPGPTAGVAWLDNVVSTISAAPKCTFALVNAHQQLICLDKHNSKVIRYSSANKVEVVYGGLLEKPRYLSIGNDRVAIVDDRRLKVFTLAGKLISPEDETTLVTKPVAVSFAGDKIIVADAAPGQLRFFNRDGKDLDARIKLTTKNKSLLANFIVADSSGNVLLSNRKDGELFVYDSSVGRTVKLENAGLKTIHGLAVDGDDKWYVLATDSDKIVRIHVYQGFRHQFHFAVTGNITPAGISVTTGKDAVISVYDKKNSQFVRYRYQQSPEKVTGLRVFAGPKQIKLRWTRSLEEFVDHYVLFASDFTEGPLERVGNFKNNRAFVGLGKHRYQRFSVRAVSGSGLEGPAAEIVTNIFEPSYQKFITGNFSEAADRFYLAESELPDDPILLEYLGRSLLKLGENKFALQVFKQLSVLPENQQRGVLWQARALFHAGRYVEANTLLASPLVRSATGLLKQDRLQLCGMVSLKLGKDSSAEKCLRVFLKQQPDDAETRAYLVMALVDQRKIKQVPTHTRPLLKTAHKHKKTLSLLMLAEYYEQSGDLKRAGYWFSRAQEIEKNNTRILSGLAVNLTKQKKYSVARQIALQMIAKASQQAKGYQLLGTIALAQKKPGEAVLSLRKSVNKEPENVHSLELLANAYLVLGNHTQSRQIFSEILRLDSGHTQTLYQLGQLEYRDGNHTAAVNYLSAVVRSQSDHVPAHELLAKIFENSGQIFLATIHALEAEHYRPDFARTRRVADLYYRQGRLPQALVYYKKLLVKKRNSAWLNFRIGSIYQQLGNMVLARRQLEKTVRLNQKNDQAYLMLAHVYRELGMGNSAIRAAKSVLAIRQSAESRLLLKTLIREHKNRSTGKKNSQLIVIQKAELMSLYADRSNIDQMISIGNIKLTNKDTKDVHDLQIRWFVEGLTRTAIRIDIPIIKARSTRVVALQLKATNDALKFKDDSRVALEIELVYPQGNKMRSTDKEFSLFVYGEHGFDRSRPETASRFMMRDLIAVKEMISDVPVDSTIKEPVTDTVLPRAASILATLRASGIEIQPAATASRAKGDRNYLQYPSESLRRGKANTDGMSILFATLLAADAIDSALLTASEDTLLLLATGMPWTNRSELKIADEQLVNYESKVWIPLDVSLIDQGFAGMWIGGVVKFKILQIRPHRIAPLSIDKDDLALSQIQISQPKPNRRMLEWFKNSEKLQLVRHMQNSQFKKAEDLGSASISLVQTARRYRKNGLPNQSVILLKQVLQSNPYNYESYMELGDVNFSRKNYVRSIEFYNKAISLKPYDATAYLKSANVLQKLNISSESAQMQVWANALTP